MADPGRAGLRFIHLMTFDQIEDGVKAAGGTISVNDPAMWITGWGGAGSNGTECCGGGHPKGGGGGTGGVAQIAVSPARA